MPFDDKGIRHYLSVIKGVNRTAQEKGWVKASDCVLTSPLNWPGFKLAKETGKGSKDARIDYNNLTPFFKELFEDIDTWGDGVISAGEMKAALKDEVLAERLSRVIAKHPSEWHVDAGLTKWQYLNEVITDNDELEEAKKQIKNMAWWDDALCSGADFPMSPNVYHLHPISFSLHLNNIISSMIPQQKIPNSIDTRLKDVKEGELVWFGLPEKGGQKYSHKIPEAKKYLTFEFKQKLIEICNDIDINPNYLMACIALETGYTFSPSIQNSIGATGLIQFTKSTAINVLHTTTDHLRSLNTIDQLDFVKKYLLKNKIKRAKDLGDVYLSIFTPAGVGKTDDHVLYLADSKGYKNNSSLDENNDEMLTKKEITKKINIIFEEGLKYVK